MLQWEDVGSSPGEVRARLWWWLSASWSHTHIHRTRWLLAACCVPRLWNNLRVRAFQHNSSLPPFKPRHDSGRDKNRTSLTSSLSLSFMAIFTLSPPLCLLSDIDAAVCKARALTQAEGCSGSRTFYSPLWEMWLSSTQYILTINQTYRRSNETIGRVIQWVESFVWCSFVVNLWSRVQMYQSVWTCSNYGSPQQNNSGVNAPPLSLLTTALISSRA